MFAAVLAGCGDDGGSPTRDAGPLDDAAAISAPNGVTATDGVHDDRVAVTWTAVSGATAYDVYRDGTLIAPDIVTTMYDDAAATAPGVPAAPSDLAATDGTRTADVGLTWTAATSPNGATHSYTVRAKTADETSGDSTADTGYRGAYPVTGYDVYRDDVVIASAVTNATYDDVGATAAAVPAAPTNFAASDDSELHVRLTWTAAAAPDGASHSYTVRATNVAGSSVDSTADVGYRGPYPVTGYEWSLDGDAWTSAGTGTMFDDQTVPAGSITAGAAVASDGTATTHVALSLSGVSTSGTSRTYRVRALNAAGPSIASNTDTGTRVVGTLTYQWERSAADSDAGYSTLAGATTASLDDTTAPAGGAGRYYRCVISAPNATSQTTTADRGHRAQPPSDVARDDFWVTNGQVNTMAVANGLLYLGGTFTYVGPETGAFAAIDASTAAPDLTRARVNGTVYAAISDGAGGWYIGGDFTQIDDEQRFSVARITAAGAVDATFGTGVNFGPVRALALSGSTLYLGGEFQGAGGQLRNRIAAVSATTGSATAWNPNANGTVLALAVSGTTVYAAGSFTMIGGQTRNGIAALNAGTGLAETWNPNATGTVSTLAVNGSTVYAGGSFTNIGGQARTNLAALDASGAATSWAPEPDGGVGAIVVDGATIYVGGGFTTIGGELRNRVAALDASTGAASTWNPDSDGFVSTLAVDGSTVYAGGLFTTIGGQARSRIAALAASGNATAWDPGAGGQVHEVAVSGGIVYAGGAYPTAGGRVRNRLAALDMTTGSATTWNPNVDGAVHTILLDGTLLYAGGNFFNVGGQTRPSLAAISTTTGAATSWAPTPVGTVNALALSGTTLYVGGAFGTIQGQSRARLASFLTTNHSITSWNPGALGTGASVNALALDGTTLVIGGVFTTVGGMSRANLAAVTAAGTTTTWNPAPNGTILALAVAGSTVYVGGLFSTIGGQPRQNIAALDSAGAATAWAPQADGTVSTIAIGSTLYVGGSFSTIGGASRASLAELDVSSGTATAWNPSANAGVTAIALGTVSVYAGGAFSMFGTDVRHHLGAFEPLP